ncbi:MAG: copper chaperone PCu(A)C [Candidatus Vesicomyosocius endoextente]|uniref:Copper chaperone PCu(A)C n=1 Tax=Candidatus Vesicomyosocius endoextente TaxID=2738853 RepID=A0A853G0Z8_9GAMM|nr:copper chaperone PCu(A)C [Candidatus Vesicomyosocius endoextente]
MFNKVKKLILAFIILIIFYVSIAMEHHQMKQITSEIMINDPWIRLAPTNASVLGLFMQINNNTNHDIKLLYVNAGDYKRIELHRTVAQNDMMKMVKQEFMIIPAKGKLYLKPGSWHIMLISPTLVLHKGDIVMIELIFDNGLTKIVYAEVRTGKKTIDNHHSIMHE